MCRKKCGGSMRLTCYVSNACRIAVVPFVWWGLFGFGGRSGAESLRDLLGVETIIGAAAGMAMLMAAVSALAFLPCGVHRRILHRRASVCAQREQ